MRRLMAVVGNGQEEDTTGGYGSGEGGTPRWVTRQVIAACLWSALFGLICGYAWLFVHVSRVHM